MINFINKFVGFVMNPLFVGMMIVVAGLVLIRMKQHRAATWTLSASLVWFWFWAMPIVGGWLAMPFESGLGYAHIKF